MIVKSVKRSWIPWKDSVLLEAKEDEEVCFDTFLGTKEFWIKKGRRVRMNIPRSDCSEVGDNYKLSYLVYLDQDKFNWTWC